MPNSREVKTNNTVDNNPKVFEFKQSIKLECLVLKADTKNLFSRIFNLALCKRIVENINLMKHEIHTDSIHLVGGTGIIIGRTVSASLDDEGRMTVIADIESEELKGRNISDFTLIPIGIGALKNGVVVDYDFSCFSLCLKAESSFYKTGILIE